MAIKVKHMPPHDLLAKGNKPQRSRLHLPEQLLLQIATRNLSLVGALCMSCKSYVRFFPFCDHLKHLIVDPRKKEETAPTVMSPLQLLDIDESVIDNNITILIQSEKLLGWTGGAQQENCSTIRGSRRQRIGDINAFPRLE